jgi:hypothetical protein
MIWLRPCPMPELGMLPMVQMMPAASAMWRQICAAFRRPRRLSGA